MVKRKRLAASGMALMLGLTGCFGGEPGEDDIMQALQDNAQFMMLVGTLAAGPYASPGAGKESLKQAKIKKSECVRPPDKPGYVCDFQLGRAVSGKIDYGPPMRGRFFKANSGWAVDLR